MYGFFFFWTWNKTIDERDPITGDVYNVFDAFPSVETYEQELYAHLVFREVAIPPAS